VTPDRSAADAIGLTPHLRLISSWQADFRDASGDSICGSLLAFTAYIGYPKTLTAFFSQGTE
jgi:hypothetical protein